jgi:hypothetical protein
MKMTETIEISDKFALEMLEISDLNFIEKIKNKIRQEANKGNYHLDYQIFNMRQAEIDYVISMLKSKINLKAECVRGVGQTIIRINWIS